MKFVWVAMICSIFVAGCTTVTPITASVTEKFEPPSDLVIERELGDWLVRYQYAVTKPSYKIVGNLDPDPLNQFEVGTILEPLGEDETFQYFRSPSALQSFVNTSLVCRHKPTGTWQSNVGTGECTEISRVTLGGYFEKIATEPANWVDVGSPNIQQQFIYNGRIDNYVKFTYREFSVGGYARDAFTQDVQYDLNEGNVIGFKGSRIEILEATNRVITYRVLSHFKGINL